jgi:hypothetical protein
VNGNPSLVDPTADLALENYKLFIREQDLKMKVKNYLALFFCYKN